MKYNSISVRCLLAFVLISFSLIKLCAQSHPVSPIPVPAPPSNLLPGKTAPAVTDIWVVFKTHADIGYTMSAEAVKKKYREEMMDNAIKLIEADRKKPAAEQFKWTIAGWPLWGAILGPLQTPERKQKVEQAIRDGYINVHALGCTIHTDAFEPEDYVRSLGFSSKVARRYGLPLPVAGKMTDVPAHSWLLPTLLHHAGIKFLQIGANYSDRPVLLPQLFWWEGPDGSRILCNYTPQYGSNVQPPKNWPAKNYLAMYMTHDNEGPPSPQQIAEVKKEAAQIKGARLHIGTLDDFARAVLAENPALPVIRADMVDPWIHGVMAMPQETKTARNIRPMEPVLDVMHTQLNLWGLRSPSIAGSLAMAYENSMLYGEHTWGAMTPGWGYFSMDGINHGNERYLYNEDFLKARKQGFYQKFEASFDEHRRYIQITDSIVTSGVKKELGLLANNVKANADDWIVYNPLPWKRSGEVVLNGETIIANDIPANGYKVIKRTKETTAATDTATMLHTQYFTVRFDTKRGGIVSLIEKATGKELVDQKSEYALGQFLHERFSYAQTVDYYNRYCVMNNASNATIKPNMPKDIPYTATSPVNWKINTEHSPAADVVTLIATDAGFIAKNVAVVFRFPATQVYVDVEWKIDGKIPNTIPEGGWLCFPFAIDQPKFIVGRNGGAIDLAKDQLTGGNRYLYGVNTGAALIAPNQSGVAICAIDAPLLSFGEPGLWKYDYDYFPKQSSVFVNLYNNMWNTNFPYWTEGSWSERVRIWGIKNNENSTENLAVKSWEARVPLLAVAANGKHSGLPAEKKGVSVSRKGVLITAFGADPDGNKGTLLRVWEQAGTSGEVNIYLPNEMKVKFATPVNLRGVKTGKKMPLAQNKLRVWLKAYEPMSFLLE